MRLDRVSSPKSSWRPIALRGLAVAFASIVAFGSLSMLLHRESSPPALVWLAVTGTVGVQLVLMVGLCVRPVMQEFGAEQRKFGALLTASPEAIIEVDANGVIISANPRTSELFGFANRELVGQRIELLIPQRFHDDHREKCAEHFAMARSRNMGSGLGINGRRADSSEFPVDISLTHLQTPRGPVVLCVVRDTSIQRAAERRLIDANDQLESRLRDLRGHADELRQLTDMGAYLHSSVSDQELFEIVAGTLRRLWPSVSGGLYIFGSSKREVGLVASWGDASGSLRRKMSAEDCWALRRGRSHQSGELINAPRCEHHDSAIQLSCQCIPLLGHGEVLGVLHLYADSAEKIGALNSGSRTGLLLAMTNQVALSLANLRLREALREQSLMDPLTGLYNRRVVDDWFEREIGDAVRDHRPLSVLVIDIDNFKRYNDTYGHECGDLALCEVAAVLRQRIRGGDLACRVGGEEFVLLLPDTTGADAVTLADALRELVASVVPTRNGKMLGRITVSIGAASLGVHGSCKEQLLRAADQALYRAKDQGRNRTVFATGLGESGVHGRTRSEANA